MSDEAFYMQDYRDEDRQARREQPRLPRISNRPVSEEDFEDALDEARNER